MKRIWLLAVLAVPVLLTGCGITGAADCSGAGKVGNALVCDPPMPEPEAGSSEMAEQLWGRAFEASTVTGTEADVDLMSDVVFTLSFEAETLSARASCNGMGGNVDYSDGKLNTSDIFATQMACEEPAMSIDTWIMDFLKAGPAFVLSGNTLTLSTDEITVELTETAPVTTD